MLSALCKIMAEFFLPHLSLLQRQSRTYKSDLYMTYYYCFIGTQERQQKVTTQVLFT